MANFDAGTIEATLKLNRTPFSQALRQAKAEGRDFDIEGNLGMDSREWEKQAKKVQAEKKKLGEKVDVEVGLDADELERDMRKTFAEVDASLAKSKDLSLQADLDKAKVDKKIAEIVAELKGIQDEKVKVDVESDSVTLATRRVGLLATALIGLSPAIVPAVAGLTAATAGLLAPLGAATLGLGAFGVTAFAAAKDTVGLFAQTSKLEAKLEETSDAAERAKIIGELAGIYDGISVEQQELIDGLGEVTAQFGELGQQSEFVLPLLSSGLRSVTDLMVPLPGLAERLLPAFREWFDGIDGWVHGQGFRDFIGFLASEGPRAISNLGRMLGGLLSTIGNLTVAFAPLGQDIFGSLADGAERLADATKEMQTSPGFQRFIEYVRETGPQVLSTLSALGESIIDIGTALAPLGGPTLLIIEALARSLSAIAEVAPGVFQAALLLGVAGRTLVAFGDAGKAIESKFANFKSTLGSVRGAMTGFKSVASGLLGVMGGPWGIALAAAGIGLTLLAQRAADAEAAQDELRTSLDQTTGALTRQSDEAATNALRTSGAIDAAKRLGIPLETLRKASLGNRDAIADVNRVMAEQSDAFAASDQQYQQRIQDVYKVDAAIETSNSTLADQRRIIAENNEVMGRSITSSDGLEFATRREADAHEEAARKVRDQRDALAEALTALRNLRDESLGFSNGQIAVEQALDDATASLNENGKTLDINTQKGRDNQSALNGIASAYAGLGDSVAFQNMSTQEQIAYQTRVRDAFVQTAIKMGSTKAEAQALAEQYGLTPDVIETKAELDTEQQKLDDWKNGLKDVPGAINTKGEFDPETESVFDWARAVTPGKGGIPLFVKTEGQLEPENGKLGKWKKDLGATPLSVETQGLIFPETRKQQGWLGLLEKTPKEKHTNARVTTDEGKVHRLQEAINGLHGKSLSIYLNTYKNTYHYDEYSSAVRQGRRPGALGGIFDTEKGVLPGYAAGGFVDATRGGVLPGFRPGVDTELALLAQGEGVLRPEVVRYLGKQQIYDWNKAAAAGQLNITNGNSGSGAAGGVATRTRVGGMQNVTLNVYNPVGVPTQIELNRQASRSRMLFDLDGADDGSFE